jgi:hypothetical protein
MDTPPVVYSLTILAAPAIRILIREKLKDGCLPYDSMPRFWAGQATRRFATPAICASRRLS